MLMEPESIIRYQLAYTYSEYSNQYAHLHSLIRVLVFCLKKHWTLYSAHRRLLSNCLDAQADLILWWAHRRTSIFAGYRCNSIYKITCLLVFFAGYRCNSIYKVICLLVFFAGYRCNSIYKVTGVLVFSLVTGVIPSTRSQAYLYFLLVTGVIPSTRSHAYLYLLLVTGAILSTRSQAYLYLSLVTGAITSKRSSVLWWLTEKLGLVAENLSFGWVRLVTVGVLWLFLTVSWVGLQCVIVVFPVHTRLLLGVCCHFQTCHRD